MRFKFDFIKDEMVQIIAVILTVVVAYIVARFFGFSEYIRFIQGMMLSGLGLCIFIGYFYRDSLGEKSFVLLIIMGMIMRIGYMLYTGCSIRQHDIGGISSEELGHASYILGIMKNHTLPSHVEGQMYQQPLFYLFGGVISSFINGVLGVSDEYYLVDATKTVSCIASCISLLLCYRIGKEVDLDSKGMSILLTLVAFLPTFYITGGTVNPDALAYMFMLYILLYVLRWKKEASWKNTVILAVLFGCGMMTKISCGVLAIITAVVFLCKLIESIQMKKTRTICLKFTVFGLISLPLGLWYSIRKYCMYGQSMIYVLKVGEDDILYTGMHSIFSRLFSIDIGNLFQEPYAEVFEDYNAPVYYLKSALFGEFKYEIMRWIPYMLLLFSAILSVFVVLSIIWHFRRNRKNRTGTLLAGFAIVYYVSMLWFYYQYPHGCSMDFRYMPFIVIPLGILLGQYGCREGWINRILKVCLCGFAEMSCIMYCMIL